jgi:hypothetical protein
MHEISIIVLPLPAAKISGFRYIALTGSKAEPYLRVFATLYDLARTYKTQIGADWTDVENSLDEHKAWKGPFNPTP